MVPCSTVRVHQGGGEPTADEMFAAASLGAGAPSPEPADEPVVSQETPAAEKTTAREMFAAASDGPVALTGPGSIMEKLAEEKGEKKTVADTILKDPTAKKMADEGRLSIIGAGDRPQATQPAQTPVAMPSPTEDDGAPIAPAMGYAEEYERLTGSPPSGQIGEDMESDDPVAAQRSESALRLPRMGEGPTPEPADDAPTPPRSGPKLTRPRKPSPPQVEPEWGYGLPGATTAQYAKGKGKQEPPVSQETEGPDMPPAISGALDLPMPTTTEAEGPKPTPEPVDDAPPPTRSGPKLDRPRKPSPRR